YSACWVLRSPRPLPQPRRCRSDTSSAWTGAFRPRPRHQRAKERKMRLLFFAGAAREGSYNKKLARLGQRIAEANGIEAVFVDLKDYPMPIYDGDLEAREGPPETARAFKALLGEYEGVFIASPEYNSSVTPLLKN